MAPRALSQALQTRLREVANLHGGRVPIHGRLFAQWMHHAFPRELLGGIFVVCRQEKEGIPRGGTAMIRPRCPYPHEFGTTSPQTPDEWMKACRFLRFRSLTFMLAQEISPYLLFSIESVWQTLRFTFCHQVYQQKVNENISFENTF